MKAIAFKPGDIAYITHYYHGWMSPEIFKPMKIIPITILDVFTSTKGQKLYHAEWGNEYGSKNDDLLFSHKVLTRNQALADKKAHYQAFIKHALYCYNGRQHFKATRDKRLDFSWMVPNPVQSPAEIEEIKKRNEEVIKEISIEKFVGVPFYKMLYYAESSF